MILFGIPALIWGSTWIAIVYQLGQVSPEVSVLYRFILSSLIMFVICWWKKAPLSFSKKHHFWFAFQGISNFSMNYIFTYHAEAQITSGLVAVTFTALIYFNMLGMHFVFKQKVSKNSILGALVGGLGIILIFAPEFLDLSRQKNLFLGLSLALIGTFCASCGNLASARHQQYKIAVLSSACWAMFYGAISTLLVVLVLQKPIVWDARPEYFISLAYLSFFGTVAAFLAYLTLIDKIGADRAAYVIVITPIIALIISTFMEGFTWGFLSLCGIGFCLLGNYLVLARH